MKEEIIKTTKEMADLYQQGWSLQRIGKKFGLTKQAVQCRLQKANVSRRGIEQLRKFDKINKAELEKLYKDDRPIKEIAKYFSTSWAVITAALKFNNIPKRGRHEHEKRAEMFRNLAINESRVVEIKTKQPAATLGTLAKQKGMRVSVRSVGDNKFRITRLN